MKNIFNNLDKFEKQRILEMHKYATKNNYLSESIKILYENPTNTLNGEINDIKARIDAQASYQIVKQGDTRLIKLTPTSALLTTSEITLPGTEVKLGINQNKMSLKFSEMEFPLGNLDVFPQFKKIYEEYTIQIKDNQLIFPDRDKSENVTIPEESMKFVNYLLSQPKTLSLFKMILNKIITKKFENLPIGLPKNPLQLKITKNFSMNTDISITHQNAEIKELTRDKIILVSNLDIDLKYNSNLPANPDDMIDKLASELASNITIPKF